MLFAELSYSMNLKTMSEEQQAAMLAFWPGCARLVEGRQRAFKDDTTKWWEIARYELGAQRITLEEAHGLEVAGIELSLEGVDGTMLTKMRHRADKYGSTITPMEMTTGQVVQIAVPDIGIMQINEVDWLEDACTQDLQRKLDDGWRILAVCPPNAQRRPDYILGRSKAGK